MASNCCSRLCSERASVDTFVANDPISAHRAAHRMGSPGVQRVARRTAAPTPSRAQNGRC